jgi:glutathione S-transferase
MEILHTINLTGANCSFVNVDLHDLKTRNSLVLKTPTATLPFLETNNGNISQSTAIEYYLCSKYKPELLGTNEFEKAKVSQWIEFGGCEINRCIKSIIYPIFGWAPYCKEKADEDNINIKKYLKIIENNLTKSNYIVGEKITLADIILFRYIRLFMMLHFPEGMRKSLFAQTTKWFEKIMKTNDAIKAYGRTVLCKIPIKAFTGEVKRIPLAQLKQEKKEKKEESKEEKKEIEEKESKEEKEEKEKSKNSHKKNETEEEKKARRKAEKEAKKKEKEKAKNKEKNWNAPKEKKEEKTKKVEYYESNAKLVRPNKGQPVLEDDSKKIY